MNPLEVEPDLATKLGDIGAHLREARQAQNTSLEEISAKTMIPTRLLSAIEDGRIENLPEPIYTRGFIRRFGDSVGLNGSNLADVFTGHRNQEQLDTEKKHKKRKKGIGGVRGGLRPVHLYILYIVLIMSAGVGLSYLTNPSVLTSSEESSPSPGTSDVQPKQESPKQKSQDTQSAKPVTTKAPVDSESVRVDLTVKEDSWMEIIVDGQVSFEGILSAGTNKTVVAKKQLVVRAGNAGGVILAVDKKPAKPMGQRGAVAELKLEPKSLTGQST